MIEDANGKIVDYLAAHRYLALATVAADGKPVAHTMGYTSEAATVCCATWRQTWKIQNIMQNPRVAYVIDGDYDDLAGIRGIQMQGKATILENPQEIERVVGLIAKKFPQFATMDPDPNVVFFKVEPSEGFFIDYSRGLGPREKATY